MLRWLNNSLLGKQLLRSGTSVGANYRERDVKMHRQWPMLRAFSKSNPRYGLPELSQ